VYLNSLSDPHTAHVLHCGDTALTYVGQLLTWTDHRSHDVLDVLVTWMLDQRSRHVMHVTPTFGLSPAGEGS
jgi:hypothetical protein